MSAESVRILTLIPAYNETTHIANVVTDAMTHLPVLVVDDGSTDETAAQAEAAGAVVLRQTPNQGLPLTVEEDIIYLVGLDDGGIQDLQICRAARDIVRGQERTVTKWTTEKKQADIG